VQAVVSAVVVVVAVKGYTNTGPSEPVNSSKSKPGLQAGFAFMLPNKAELYLIVKLKQTFFHNQPLYFVVIASIGDSEAVSLGEVLWWLVDFNLRGYGYIFKNPDIWMGYGNTIFYTV